MIRSPIVKRMLVAAAVMAALALLRFRPWQGGAVSSGERETLTVGYLPVT